MITTQERSDWRIGHYNDEPCSKIICRLLDELDAVEADCNWLAKGIEGAEHKEYWRKEAKANRPKIVYG